MLDVKSGPSSREPLTFTGLGANRNIDAPAPEYSARVEVSNLAVVASRELQVPTSDLTPFMDQLDRIYDIARHQGVSAEDFFNSIKAEVRRRSTTDHVPLSQALESTLNDIGGVEIDLDL